MTVGADRGRWLAWVVAALLATGLLAVLPTGAPASAARYTRTASTG